MVARFFARILEDRHGPEWVAVIVAISTFAFGCLLVDDPSGFVHSPAYVKVAAFAPFAAWGWVMIALAVLHVVVRFTERGAAWIVTVMTLGVYVTWDGLIAVTPHDGVFPGWSFTVSLLCAYLLLHRMFSPAWHPELRQTP